MHPPPYKELYTRDVLARETKRLFPALGECDSIERVRGYLLATVQQLTSSKPGDESAPAANLIRVRDCAQALSSVLGRRSETRSGHSVAQALWDLANGRPRDDLQTGFYAELINWLRGVDGQARTQYMGEAEIRSGLSGRAAAKARSAELDRLWAIAESNMARFGNGLSDEACSRRRDRRRHVMKVLQASQSDWSDWQWQVSHVVVDAETLGRLVRLRASEREAIARALDAKLPFAVTPYYVSLMDDPGSDLDSDLDRAIRAQVIPTHEYVDWMLEYGDAQVHSCDFMLEADTSPIDLITRRYPAIVILKPHVACPQICVYCQRNWEIAHKMSPEVLPDETSIEAAIDWIERHSAIREVLVTGGDPFILEDDQLERLLHRLAKIPHVDLIRLGTRTPVTLPMRITPQLASMLGSFREVGRRDIVVVTHIEHAYEVTMDTAVAIDRLRRNGVGVYNQLVYTFHVSRRFESALLRMLLRPIGVDPYYTFVPKGKMETNRYRVPIARLMQEQKEEARLVPGTRRTDEAVFNVPGLGKNYLRALQHRDLVTVLPDGARVYEFHPWEMNLVDCEPHLAVDVPILDYLVRLAEIGENLDDYDSIWYYF